MIKLFLTDLDGVLTNGKYIVSMKRTKDVDVVPAACVTNIHQKITDTFLSRSFHTRDFHGFSLLQEQNILTGIITNADRDCIVEDQIARSKSHCMLFPGTSDKKEFVQRGFIDHGFNGIEYKWEDIAYIGDDLDDVELLKKVGFAACPADAEDEVIEVIKLLDDGCVLNRRGGEGCVREFINLLLPNHAN